MAGGMSASARLATPAAADTRKRRRDRSCDTMLSLSSSTADKGWLVFFNADDELAAKPADEERPAHFRVTWRSQMSDVALLPLRCFHQHGMHRLQYFIGQRRVAFGDGTGGGHSPDFRRDDGHRQTAPFGLGNSFVQHGLECARLVLKPFGE